jgi:uncharacterized protein (TIGR00297 family)
VALFLRPGAEHANRFRKMQIFIRLLIGFLLAGAIGYLAYRARALSTSGGWAAALTGGLIFGIGGLSWGVLLLTFFISSSALSRLFSRRKASINEKFSKGSQRDWGQVLANGSLGALLALALGFWPASSWPWFAFIGAMAAVNADTWATELGVLSRSEPRLISNGQRVERGTSGGITILGILSTLGGAALIGLMAILFNGLTGAAGLLAALSGGLVGSLFDSWLGATVQAIYYCPACEKETERFPQHTCGTPTCLKRGWSWLNNDWVNFACSLAGALVALGAWRLLA